MSLARHFKGRGMEQDVGTVYPVDMGLYRLEPPSGYVLKPKVHFHLLMKDLNPPSHAVPHHDLPKCCFKIIAGQVFSSTIRSFLTFRTNQLDLPHRAEIAHELSGAKINSLPFRTIRSNTNSLPLEPAMIPEKISHLDPTLRLRGVCISLFGLHTSGFAQGDNEGPLPLSLIFIQIF